MTASDDADGALVLDLRGLKCPLPVLRTRKALRGLPAGAVVTVWCTDPLATLDLPHMAAEDGHIVLAVDRQGASSRVRLRKGAG